MEILLSLFGTLTGLNPLVLGAGGALAVFVWLKVRFSRAKRKAANQARDQERQEASAQASAKKKKVDAVARKSSSKPKTVSKLKKGEF